jgi:hypothetical protein
MLQSNIMCYLVTFAGSSLQKCLLCFSATGCCTSPVVLNRFLLSPPNPSSSSSSSHLSAWAPCLLSAISPARSLQTESAQCSCDAPASSALLSLLAPATYNPSPHPLSQLACFLPAENRSGLPPESRFTPTSQCRGRSPSRASSSTTCPSCRSPPKCPWTASTTPQSTTATQIPSTT